MTYLEKLKDPRWQKKRLEILNRDEFRCVHCSDTETTLHVHHKKYTNEPWDAPNKDLETVCEHCHCAIEHIEGIKNAEIKGGFAILDRKKTVGERGVKFSFLIHSGVFVITKEDGLDHQFSFIPKKDIFYYYEFYNKDNG